MLLVSSRMNILGFIKKGFFIRGCIKMRKHVETFDTNKSYKLALSIFTKLAVFKKEICGTLFKPYKHENETLHTPSF